MNQTTTIVLSVVFTLVVLVGVTAFVSSRVRRASSVSTREATRSNVSFIVCSRRWQSILLRGTGILFVVIGCLLLLVAIVPGTIPSAQGEGIPGVIIAIVGLVFLWLARRLARARLEVTPDSIWVFRGRGTPREVPVSSIARLRAMTSNNYGGVVIHPEQGRSFSANRLMLGYSQLIDYLQTNRPDLPIPDASGPL
ncbi:MAG: hypothetical protein ABI400_12580 [Lacisediminihabitans sp.]